MKIIFRILLLLTAYFAGNKILNAFDETIDIPTCKKTPVIDGKLDDICWEESAIVDKFNVITGKRGTTQKYKAYVTRDDKWLYVAYEVSLPLSARMPGKYLKHDHNVQREDSVEVSFDPGTNGDIYYQFLVNKINTRADFLMTRSGGRNREGWNIPWRSATNETKDGWSAEIALPFSLMISHGDLEHAKLNLLATSFVAERDQCHVLINRRRELVSWVPLKRHFHEPERFGKIKNLGDANLSAPFLPFITSASIGRYYRNNDRDLYDVTVKLANRSGRKGNLILQATDKTSDGKTKTISVKAFLNGGEKKTVKIAIPVTSLVKRTSDVMLVLPKNKEIMQKVILNDTSALDLFSSYLNRNYYTSEKHAIAICRIGLPEASLKNMKLIARDAKGNILSEDKKLYPEALFKINLDKVKNGKQKIKVQLCYKNGKVVTEKELELIKRTPKKGIEWKVDRQHRCFLKNDIPYFPFGIYATQIISNEAAFKDQADMGFNTVLQWNGGPEPEKITDYLVVAEKYGLNVIVSPDLLYCSYNEKTKLHDPDKLLTTKELAAANKMLASSTGSLATAMKGTLLSATFNKLTPAQRGQFYMQYYKSNLPRLQKVIELSKGRKNVLGYFILDEPIIIRLDEDVVGKAFYKKIKELDGYHPVLVNYSSHIPPTDRAIDWSDALGTDPYWYPDAVGDLRASINWVSKVVAETNHRAKKVRSVVWTIPMSEFWSGCKKRICLYQEQLCQSYLALIHGSKGLIYFRYAVYTEQMALAYKTLAKQLKVIGPACLTGDMEYTVKYSPGVLAPSKNKFTDIQVSLKKNPSGGYLLLVANSKEYPVKARFKIPGIKGKTVKVLFAEKQLKIANGVFDETIEPLGVRAYQLDIDYKKPLELRVNMQAEKEKERKTSKFNVWLEEDRALQKGNLLPNSGFEEAVVANWPDFWKFWGSNPDPDSKLGTPDSPFVLDRKVFRSGKQSMRITAKDGKQYIFYNGIVTNFNRPTKVKLQLYARVASDGTRVRLIVRGKGCNGDKWLNLTKKWKCYSYDRTISPGRQYFTAYIFVPSQENGNKKITVWTDDWSLTRSK